MSLTTLIRTPFIPSYTPLVSSDPALVVFGGIERVAACRALAEATGFRCLGAQRVRMGLLRWVREVWVRDAVTLIVTDLFYAFETTWAEGYDLTSFSNRYPLSRPHEGYEVLAGTGEGFEADLEQHEARLQQLDRELGPAELVVSLEDASQHERRYFRERMPFGRWLIVGAPGPLVILVLALVVPLLACLPAAGLPVATGKLVPAVGLGALIFIQCVHHLLHAAHFHDRSREASSVGVDRAKSLAIVEFERTVATSRPTHEGDTTDPRRAA